MFLLGAASAATPDVLALRDRLLREPEATATALRDPDGELAFAWPEVRGPLEGAPVWILTANAELSTGAASWDGVLAWTARAAVDHVVLRLPVTMLGGTVGCFTIDGVPLSASSDLVRIDLRAGETIALRMTGAITAGVGGTRMDRLLFRPDALTLAGWLPLPTPCDDAGSCDELPWEGTSDPGAHDAMIFVAELTTDAAAVLHPGVEWSAAEGRRGIAAVGVRELPLVLLDDGWSALERDGLPKVRVWSRPEHGSVEDLAVRVRAALDDFSNRYGRLPHATVDLVPTLPGRESGVELPSVILLSTDDVGAPWCFVVAHEVAHQWWYGEVGSDALAEPWVDEALASWSAVDHCAREGDGTMYRVLHLRAEAARPHRGAETAGELGPQGMNAVYGGGALFFDELHRAEPAGLDEALRRWLEEERWRFATGATLRRILADEVGRRRVRGAWNAWMAPTDRSRRDGSGPPAPAHAP